jgi:hypothetical protein
MSEEQRKPFGNFPAGLVVTPWADGVMISVVDQSSRHGIATYLGHDGIVRLFQWLLAAGIVQGELTDEVPASPESVLLQWPGSRDA